MDSVNESLFAGLDHSRPESTFQTLTINGATSEQALARLTVENVALESIIDEAQSNLGVDLKKTFGMGR